MQSTGIEIVDVDENLIDEIWDKVKESPSFESIGDGCSRAQVHKVYFESNLVIRANGSYARFEVNDSYVEIHVMIFKHSFFRDAKENLRSLYAFAHKSFQNRPIRCMIPNEMRGFKRLAEIAGMRALGLVSRNLSGVPITCAVFEWRPEYV